MPSVAFVYNSIRPRRRSASSPVANAVRSSMRDLAWTSVACLLGLIAPSAALQAQTAEPAVDFTRDIKPILSNACFKCHGPDSDERKGGTDGLRLDTPEGAQADLGGSAAIVAGKPDKSQLIVRVTASDPGERMPPPESGRQLTPREVELLTRWIKQGAPYARHWAYVKPVRPNLPSVTKADWPKNDVDTFLLARLEREGLAPAPEADRYSLIRRASLDITGLPPTRAEVEAFVNDPDPRAFDKVVDRLLEKEAYGEHWARMWLDLARYADSAGYADDPPRTIWLFRDYVIRSLNANKRFDQFTIEQIAGDLLPNATDEQVMATAFHRNTLTNNEGGTNDEEFRNVAIVDRVNTTMAVWMGTTMNCAQCHNHKYDPISQEDFFRFFAIFNNSADADRGDESPLLSMLSDDQRTRQQQWQEQIARLEQTLRATTPELDAARAKWEQSFPRDIAWQSLKPAAVRSKANAKTTIADDGAVLVAPGAATDSYSIEIPLTGGKLRALRLEALADDSLPAKGPGHANGNFVLSRVAATLSQPENQPLSGRYVRVEIAGKQKILSLAEVQAFQGTNNVAVKGTAKQSTTDFGGDAARAVDGNTDGRYAVTNSTTHTAISDDPWWEVDLGAAMPLDRLVIWNRTDPGVDDRLSQFRVAVLDDNRQTVWQQVVAAAPKPSVELSLGGQRAVEFTQAVADYAQDGGFDAEQVLRNKDAKKQGWAVGGETGRNHALTLVTAAPVDLPAGTRLTITIDHAEQLKNHVLGRFRLSITDDARALELGRTPLPLVELLRKPAAERSAAENEALTRHYATFAPELDATRKQLADVRKQLADVKPATVPVMRELPTGQRRVTKIQHRGNFLDVGKEVAPGTPASFHPLPAEAAPDRLSLARWLIDSENPLTARVIANRYWEQLFGIGIVATSEEFGSQGELPYHPELLDYLATELIRNGWDMKAFIRLLVTSAAYRQSSRVTPELEQRDPDNRLLARGPRFRLSAEMIRDQALAASGLLSAKMYGPPVKPPQPSLGISAAFGSGIDWQTSAGEDRYRRGLYTTWRRSNPYPSMATFDAPNREVCIVKRDRTNTPLQALVTLNDPVYVEAAQALARRTVAEGGATPADRATWMFQAVLTRPPHAKETARLIQLFDQSVARFQEKPDDARRIATEPLGPAAKDANLAELAAWTVVANVVLNLDEALMKR